MCPLDPQNDGDGDVNLSSMQTSGSNSLDRLSCGSMLTSMAMDGDERRRPRRSRVSVNMSLFNDFYTVLMAS